MKKSLLFVALAVVAQLANAQQDPQFTNWMFDRVSFNPAASGMVKRHCISLFHRDQWDGFDRDPKTYMFNYNGYLPGSLPIGLGATFYTEVLGQEKNNIFRVSPSYHYSLPGGNMISGGLSLGYASKTFGKDWVYIDPDDSAIPLKGASQGKFDLGLGLMFYKDTKYYAGVSATHLTAAELDKLNVQMARHYYFMGGYNYDINADFKLRSNLLLKSDFSAKPAFDVNINALWREMVWGGLSYRPGDAIAPMLGFQKCLAPAQKGRTSFAQCFMLGYSYDITTSQIKDYSAGSHEIFVTYCFNISQMPIKSRHGNPRFL
ncbi:MAG: type IX secretion system membrane protein PorP/SprF [Crocinitomicaceae bacterium]|nr:type IX secretion system membrane protein PorP/SprF [Crocinitomicaceae bacterium]